MPDPQHCPGLLATAEKTQQTFQAQLGDAPGSPYLRTGDLGFLHNQQLYVTGRLKELIIIRGRNHYPQDLEATAEQAHPALRPGCGAAFSVDMAGVEQVVLVQELERSYLRKLEPEEVFAAIRRQVSQHHDLQLGAIVLIKTNSLPKTSSGKIQRYLCRSLFLDSQLDVRAQWPSATELSAAPSAAPAAPSAAPVEAPAIPSPPPQAPAAPALPMQSLAPDSSLKQWLVEWLAQALSLAPATIDVHRPFAEYGLDSLAAVEIAEALQTRLGIPLSPTLAYEYPTIDALVRHLNSHSLTPEPPTNDAAPDPPPMEFAGVDAEVEQLVRELEMLSDRDVEELLSRPGYFWS